MSDRRIDALLERLVAQFSSPYDFLRELVQNAMDAGSDLVDVALRTHPGDGDQVVFELEVVDAGDGMDEAIIDGELTRLFASSKSGDRTMAGGFGIGFVSVFAWEPQMVLLQTGRRDEAWELVFGEDKGFEKHAVDGLLEGTTLRLFRVGQRGEREAVAEAIRDSLWRWCRFCPIEITFEDLEGDVGPELIRDAPVPEDAVVQLEHVEGETTIRAAFAPVPHVVLLRHGLVLAEGTPAEHLPHLGPKLGRAAEHLRLWIDSPRLRTSLARDSVIDDAGRAGLEREVAGLLDQLRGELLQRVEAAAAAQGWQHDRFAFAHAHLGCEREAYGALLPTRPVLRSLGGSAISPVALRSRAKLGVVATVGPDEETSPEQAGLRVGAILSGVPVLVARWPDDRNWLQPLLDGAQLRAVPLHAVATRLEAQHNGEALANLVHAVLVRADIGVASVKVGKLLDARGSVCAFEKHAGVGLHGVRVPLVAMLGAHVWLDAQHPLVEEAEDLYTTDPSLAALALAEAIAGAVGAEAPSLAGVAEAWAATR